MSGRILVVDDTATNRLVLKAKLSTAYYTVLLAAGGAEALALAEEHEPDLVLLDVLMPGMDGFEVCRRLKASERLQHVPVVMVTALNAPEEKLRGLEAGADDFLARPFSDTALFARVRNLVRMKMMFDELRLRDITTRELGIDGFGNVEAIETGGAHVLFVAAREEHSAVWAAEIAARLGVRATACATGLAALELIQRDAPDAVVVHQRLGGGEDGRRLVPALRARGETRQAAVIFAVEEGGDAAVMAQVLDLGASDCLLPPFDLAELAVRLRTQLRRKRLSDRLRDNLRAGLRLAMVDPLTGLFNRRYASRHLETFAARARATGRSFAMMMLDLDRFKSVNDRYGHEAGDEVLREFARRLLDNVRSGDLVARLGGEEFFVAMPDIDAAQAAEIAERVRGAVAGTPFVLRDGALHLPVTVSIGLSLAEGGNGDPAELIRRADAALYASKHAGRNRVTFASAA